MRTFPWGENDYGEYSAPTQKNQPGNSRREGNLGIATPKEPQYSKAITSQMSKCHVMPKCQAMTLHLVTILPSPLYARKQTTVCTLKTS